MIRRLAAAALLLLASIGAPTGAVPGAAACPEPGPTLIFHSCWKGGRLDVALLPENLPLPLDGDRLMVTGVYTSTESRGDTLRKPVGLFIHQGAVINRNLGRMDGVMIVDPATGVPELWHRTRVGLGADAFDLTMLGRRRAFIDAARRAGISVLQSHLLIVDGEIDVRPQDDAPVFLRRILFTDPGGFGIYQSRVPVTLYDAAAEVETAFSPSMALNLDMGSYDFCQRLQGGAASQCGLLGRADIQKLSNLLVISTGG